MSHLLKRCALTAVKQGVRHNTCSHMFPVQKCKVLIVGGGTGGCSIAWRLSRTLEPASIIVLEPSKLHFYQPNFSLVGAGLKTHKDCSKPTRSVLPPSVTWVEAAAECLDPDRNEVWTRDGHVIQYQYLVVAVGVVNDYEQIPGLRLALDDPNSGVSSIYSRWYCSKTWCNLKRAAGGLALFTYPRHGNKCSGAAQKIMYMAESHFTKRKIRPKMNIMYNTGSKAIFGVPKYEEVLSKVAQSKDIVVNCDLDLVEVRRKEAVFQCAGSDHRISLPFNILHVTPPMRPVQCIACSPLACGTLANEPLATSTLPNGPLASGELASGVLASGEMATGALGSGALPNKPLASGPSDCHSATGTNATANVCGGWLAVCPRTLRHSHYPNVFGIGDCLDTPNSKTAAAAAAQSYVVEQNLLNVMNGKEPTAAYNGYSACPIMTSYKKAIIAEFDYDKKPLESTPFDQSTERRFFGRLNKSYFPYLYWNKIIKGKWNGPQKKSKMRKEGKELKNTKCK